LGPVGDSSESTFSCTQTAGENPLTSNQKNGRAGAKRKNGEMPFGEKTPSTLD